VKIDKKVCDNCKTEQDLLAMRFPGHDSWQILYLDTEHERRKRVDFCCNECVVDYLVRYMNKEKTP